jgi:hypothetical protein
VRGRTFGDGRSIAIDKGKYIAQNARLDMPSAASHQVVDRITWVA